MLCEVAWTKGQYFLAALIKNPEIPQKVSPQDTDTKEERESLSFPLLNTIFGPYSFLKGYRKEHEWLQNQLQEFQEPFQATLWYPAFFTTPGLLSDDSSDSVEVDTNVVDTAGGDSFEQVLISRSSDEKEQIKIISRKDKSPIEYVVVKPLFVHFGFQLVTANMLQKKYGFNLLENGPRFHKKVLKEISRKDSDRTVKNRLIYYLDSLFPDMSLGEIAKEYLDLDYIMPLIGCLMQWNQRAHAQIELFSAFVVVVPTGKEVPDQMIHRDSLYESMSIFFYLDDLCEPRTGFFPFTHRLLQPLEIEQSVLEGEFIPKMRRGDVLFMDGRLSHHGLGSHGKVNDRPRVLYVFQFQLKCGRKQQSQQINQYRKQLAQVPHQTVFQK